MPLFHNPTHNTLHEAGFLVNPDTGEAMVRLTLGQELLLMQSDGEWKLVRAIFAKDRSVAIEEKLVNHGQQYEAMAERAADYLRWWNTQGPGKGRC